MTLTGGQCVECHRAVYLEDTVDGLCIFCHPEGAAAFSVDRSAADGDESEAEDESEDAGA